MPISKKSWMLSLAILAWVTLLVPRTASADRLTDDQRDGYRVWLHSLETTVRARLERGDPETGPLYPFGLVAEGTVAVADTMSLLNVARALEELEARPRILQEPSHKTALHAITRARNYRNIAEYDTALAWYEEALRRDQDGAFGRELLPETMAVAAAAGDSSTVSRILTEVFAADDPAVQATELRLGHRFFIARGDTAEVDRLIGHLDAHAADLPADLSYWHAFALSWRGSWARSLAVQLDLVSVDGQSLGLSEGQRTWVLVAIADHLVLTGHNAEAAPLYRALAASNLPGAGEWARCQVAVLDFLDGRYLEAGTALADLCGQRQSFPWRAYACGMSQLSDEMQRLRNEGIEHGAASHYQR